MEDLRFPIGPFQYDPNVSPQERQARIEDIAATASRVREAVAGLTEEQLDTPYRPEGWTARQVAHHVADASITMFTRLKLALTEDKPLVKTFEENEWVKLADSDKLPVEPSLLILDGLHARADSVLRALPEDAFTNVVFQHPASGENTLDRLIAYFAWHGKHHAAHISSLRSRNGW